MDSNLVYRKNIFDILELWSSKEMQIEYQNNVSIAQVSAELFCQWDDYYAEGFDLDKFLSEDEILLFNEFNETIIEICEKTPRDLPYIFEFIETNEWKVVNKKAIEISEKLTLINQKKHTP